MGKKVFVSIPYTLFLRLIRTYSESHHLIRAEIEMYFHFLRWGYPSDIIVKGWQSASNISRDSLLNPPLVKRNRKWENKTCQYCARISHNGSITRHDTMHSFYTIMHENSQSNNLIYYLECKICHMNYVGETKNRILDRFQVPFFEITQKHYFGKASCQP